MTNCDLEDEYKLPLSANFTIKHIDDTSVRVKHKYTLSSIETQTFSVSFDHSGKYLA